MANYTSTHTGQQLDATINKVCGIGYGTCSTTSGTALTATCTGYELIAGVPITIKFIAAVPASSTLNINNCGAKPIYYRGSTITTEVINAGDVVTFVYDGTNYILISSVGRKITVDDANSTLEIQ